MTSELEKPSWDEQAWDQIKRERRAAGLPYGGDVESFARGGPSATEALAILAAFSEAFPPGPKRAALYGTVPCRRRKQNTKKRQQKQARRKNR